MPAPFLLHSSIRRNKSAKARIEELLRKKHSEIASDRSKEVEGTSEPQAGCEIFPVSLGLSL